MANKSVPKLSPSQRKKWLELLQASAEPAIAGSSDKSQVYPIVVDTNILISAILYGGKPEAVLRHVQKKQTLVLSDYIVEELVDYLRLVKPRVSRKWLRVLRQKLEVYCYDDAVDIDEPVRDINDVDVVKLAIKQKAIIVTGDKDLLEHKSSSHVAILSSQEYTEIFEL